MNKKGQALVEFVIILPVFLFLVLGVIDIGKIIYNQNILESKLNDVVNLLQNQRTYNDVKNYLKKEDSTIDSKFTNEDNNYIEIELMKKMVITTPGLNQILDNPYEIKVKRVILYEG